MAQDSDSAGRQVDYTSKFWAKASPYRAKRERGPERIHLLEHHLADVAACLEALLSQPTIRGRLAATGGRAELDEATRARLCVFAGLHDIGKANVGFQTQVWRQDDLRRGRGAPGRAGHTLDLAPVLGCDDRETCDWFFDALDWERMMKWDSCEGEVVSDLLVASLSHHGKPLQLAGGRQANPSVWRSYGALEPERYVRRVLSLLREWFAEAWREDAPPLPEQAEFQHMFLGLATLADWIGSNKRWFPYEDAVTDDYMSRARSQAGKAVREIGLDISAQRAAVAAWGSKPDFGELFDVEGGTANAVQQAAALDTPLDQRLVVIESETGSGKTEAALWRFIRMYWAGLVDGLYFALPTRAAATQICGRVKRFVEVAFPEFPEGSQPHVVRAVPEYIAGKTSAGDALQPYRVWWDEELDRTIDDEEAGRRWSAEHSKRYLAAQIAVGSIDQAMLGALKVRHAHLRSACLARNLLVVDEVHASDTYMRSIIGELLDAHLKAGGYALLMSATLGSAARAQWLCAGSSREASAPSLDEAIESPYPAVSTATSTGEGCIAVGANGRERVIQIEASRLMHDFEAVAQRALDAARSGAKVLVVRNTVDYAVRTQRALESALLDDSDRALCFSVNDVLALHHGRFAVHDRGLLDLQIESRIGKYRPAGGLVVVGTQTLEQSLDIDADLLISDLCPVDVLLQRIGRLHRHQRDDRASGYEQARCVALVPDMDDLSPLLERGANGLNQFVYPDLRILEATRRLVVGDPEWSIPGMNRELVERATHPAALDGLVEELGGDWRAHANDLAGGRIAEWMTAQGAIIDRSKRFCVDNEEVLFGSVEERIRTRLGEQTIEFDLKPAIPSPFDASPIERLKVPLRWLGAGWEGASVAVDQDGTGATVSIDGLRSGTSVRYDRFGLSRQRGDGDSNSAPA